MSLLGLLELYLRCWGVPPFSTGSSRPHTPAHVILPQALRSDVPQWAAENLNISRSPRSLNLTRGEGGEAGWGEASREVPLLRGVTWRASVASVATCAQLPKTVLSAVCPAAATILSLSGPWVCPCPFSVHPAAVSLLLGAGAVGCGSHDRACAQVRKCSWHFVLLRRESPPLARPGPRKLRRSRSV